MFISFVDVILIVLRSMRSMTIYSSTKGREIQYLLEEFEK